MSLLPPLRPGDQVPVLEYVAKHLGSWPKYQPHTPNVLNLSDFRGYYASRCIDVHLAGSMALIRFERCTIVSVFETDRIRATSDAAAAAFNESQATLLFGILRPAVEMYAELVALGRHDTDPEFQELICKIQLLAHMVGDYQQKLKTCEDIYGCSPSYFAAIVSGWTKQLDQARSKLSGRAQDFFAAQANKFSSAFREGSILDRLAMGPDSFLSLTVPAYGLHFLPQKAAAHTHDALLFLRARCATLLILLGRRIASLVGMPVDFGPSVMLGDDHALLASPGVPPGPQTGDVVFFDWGVAHIQSVESRPIGNDVLTVVYDVPFVDGLISPDRVPRRFSRCQLASERYSEVLREQMQLFAVSEPSQLLVAASEVDKLDKLMVAFLQCRPDVSAA